MSPSATQLDFGNAPDQPQKPGSISPPLSYPENVTRFADGPSMWMRRTGDLVVLGVILLLVGFLLQTCNGDTSGWTASSHLDVPTADDAETPAELRRVLLSLDEEAFLAQQELGPAYSVRVDAEASTLVISIEAESEEAATSAMGQAVDLTSRDVHIADRGDREAGPHHRGARRCSCGTSDPN